MTQGEPAETQHEMSKLCSWLASGHDAVDIAKWMPRMQDDRWHEAAGQVQGAVHAVDSEGGGGVWPSLWEVRGADEGGVQWQVRSYE